MVEALRFSGVEKCYGPQQVLKGVDFTVGAGEYFALVGVNGAGKTTLIKSLLDFCSINAGSVQLFGRSHRDTLARQRIAFLPERFIPSYYLKGREFLRHMGELHGVRYEREDVEAIFNHLDLDLGAFSRPVRSYSKGMAQKLGIAACILSKKELLVMDEPMSGLDPKARALFKTYLLEQKSKGQSLFFTTHLLNDVETLCDRLAILHEGKIVFVGSPGECCQQYQQPDIEKAYLAAIGS